MKIFAAVFTIASVAMALPYVTSTRLRYARDGEGQLANVEYD